MNKRSVVAVILLTIVTLGIYSLIWAVKTKNEMNEAGAQIPTAWLIIIPIVGIWWWWKYCGGVEHITSGKMSQVIAFILIFVLGIIGMAIVQAEFNKAVDRGIPGRLPAARVA
jgi:uncharacterized membrane protein YjgN (DUF898 family)